MPSMVAGNEDLVNYRTLAPHAQENHPTDDRYVPLLIALGADGKAERVHASDSCGTISTDCYAFD